MQLKHSWSSVKRTETLTFSACSCKFSSVAAVASPANSLFFTADILTCHSRKSTVDTNFINDCSVPSSVPINHDSEPACTIPGPWNWLTYMKCRHF